MYSNKLPAMAWITPPSEKMLFFPILCAQNPTMDMSTTIASSAVPNHRKNRQARHAAEGISIKFLM